MELPRPTPGSTSRSPVPGDWPTKAADAIENVVALLRDRTVRPVALVARVVIFGIIILSASVTIITLLAIALIRILTVYAFNGRVWAADLVVGAAFVVIGLIMWSLRTDPNATATANGNAGAEARS